MTDADLDGLERLATAATPGPWRADAEKQDNPLTGDYDGCRDYVVSADDDTTIAHLGPCGGCERACSRRAANSDNPLASLRPDEDVFRLGDACYPDRRADRNAGFIAAADPAAVLALVAEVRRLRASLPPAGESVSRDDPRYRVAVEYRDGFGLATFWTPGCDGMSTGVHLLADTALRKEETNLTRTYCSSHAK